MIPYNVPINAQRMTIGVQGENNVRQFLFDVTEWRQITGDIGAAEMVVQRNGDSSPYATVITMKDENTVSWVPTETDTAKIGVGKIQLMWIANNRTVKTKVFNMKVDPSLDYAVPDDSLDPWASWMPNLLNADARIKSLEDEVDDVIERQTSPYNFCGSCTSDTLPENPAVNDTWYLTDMKYRVTWTGSAWQQSSMEESAYTTELGGTKAALTAVTGVAPITLNGGACIMNVNGHARIDAPRSSQNYSYAIVPCQEGDVFTVSGTSDNEWPMAWEFIDADNLILKRAASNTAYTDYVVTAPEDAVNLVINSLSGQRSYLGNIRKCDEQRQELAATVRGVNGFLGNHVTADFERGYFDMDVGPILLGHVRRESKQLVYSAEIPCAANDLFFVHARTNNDFYAYVFFDENGNWLSKSRMGDEVDQYVRAPENAAWLIVHSTDETHYVYSGENPADYILAAMEWDRIITFEQGVYLDRDGVTKGSATTRIRNVETVPVVPGLRIKLPEGHSAWVHQLDASKKRIEPLGYWVNEIREDILATGTKYINFNVRDDDNSSPLPSIDFVARSIAVTAYGEEPDRADITLNHYTAGKRGVTIDANGELVTDAQYAVSGLAKIPTKYRRSLLFTHAFSESGYSSAVAFYDANREFITLATGQEVIDNDDTYAFCRAVFPIADKQCAIFFSNEQAKPQYEDPKAYPVQKNGLMTYDANVISDGAIDAIIRTGIAYWKDEAYGYGTEHTAFAEACYRTTRDTHTDSSAYEGERYQMDCSTYVMLMLMGITPECTRYHGNRNIPAPHGYRFNRLVQYEGYVYGVKQTADTKRLYANSIAEYAYKNGFLFEVDEGMKNLRPGDVFFHSNQGKSYHFFENIGHCGMVVDVMPMADGTNAILTLEGNGGEYAPCKLHTKKTAPTTMHYAARFPMPYVSSCVKDISLFASGTQVQVSGSGTVTLADIPLAEPLTSGAVYTVVIDCKVPAGARLKLKDNGASYLGFSDESGLVRPDGKAVLRVMTAKTDTISDPESLTLQMVTSSSVSGDVTITSFHVFNGFVTHW